MGSNELRAIRIADYHGYLLRQYNISSLQKPLKELFDSGFTSQPALTASQEREVYRLKIHSERGQPLRNFEEVYVKRYHVTTFKQRLQTFFWVHKAQKSWRFGRCLLKKGITTPQPIAYLSRWASFFVGERILITKGIPNGRSLLDYVHQDLPDNKLSLAEKRLLIRAVAEFLGKVHFAGVYHGDLTAGNIFVEHAKVPGTFKRTRHLQSNPFRIYLIDLDSIGSMHWISSRRRIKNLDELGRNFLDLRVISTSERARFLKHYLKTNSKERKPFRQLFRDVFQRTQRRLKKHNKQFTRSDRHES